MGYGGRFLSGYEDAYQWLNFLAAFIKVFVVHNKGAGGCTFFHLVCIYKNNTKKCIFVKQKQKKTQFPNNSDSVLGAKYFLWKKRTTYLFFFKVNTTFFEI